MHQFKLKSAVLRHNRNILLNVWATFARNFVPKNFQKSPNLVTLSCGCGGRTMASGYRQILPPNFYTKNSHQKYLCTIGRYGTVCHTPFHFKLFLYCSPNKGLSLSLSSSLSVSIFLSLSICTMCLNSLTLPYNLQGIFCSLFLSLSVHRKHFQFTLGTTACIACFNILTKRSNFHSAHIHIFSD